MTATVGGLTVTASINVIDPTDVGVAWDVGAIGTIDAAGGFIAGTGAGTFAKGIFATVTQGGAPAEATAAVAILPGPLVAVSIAPENPVVDAGRQLRLTALPVEQHCNAIVVDDVTSAADPRAGVLGLGGMLGASSSTAVFGEGVKVTVLKDGVTRSFISSLEVTYGALDSFSIAVASEVLAIGGQTSLDVVASDAFGNPVPTSGVRWAVAGETHSVAADGTFTAGVCAGAFTVTGTLSAGGASQDADATITVTPDPFAGLNIDPVAPTAAAGSSITFTPKPVDQYGNSIDGLTATWSTPTDAGSIDQAGV